MINDPHIKNWAFNKNKAPAVRISTLLFALAVLAAAFFPGWLTITLLVLTALPWLIILYFFRDPARSVLEQPGLVVGPGDGEIVSIEKFNETRYLNTETIRISMFLSLFDVHVQRAPLAGKVTLVDHQPGKFLQAFRPEASEVNEYIMMQIETPFGTVMVKQISGILARRCMNYAQPGDTVQTGQRFGHIKFGSRVDLYLPLDADVQIKVGDKVSGGLTPIAQLPTQNNE